MGKTKWDEADMVEVPHLVEVRLREFVESIGFDRFFVVRPVDLPLDLCLMLDKMSSGGRGFCVMVRFNAYELTEASHLEGFGDWLYHESIRRLSESLLEYAYQSCSIPLCGE